MTTSQLTEKEQRLFTLIIVNECIKYVEEEGKDFEEVLTEDLFMNVNNDSFERMILKWIERLHKEKYINGKVELVYEKKYAEDNSKVLETLDSIHNEMCIFEDIELTLKGIAYLKVEGFKEKSKEFYEKCKPLIELIAIESIKIGVEIFISSKLH